MNDIVTALDHKTQDKLGEVLARAGLDQLRQMRDETIATLAALGRHPEHLRSATLSITPMGVRSELSLARLAQPRSPEDVAWELTRAGNDVATLLAKSLPAATAEEQDRARGSLARRREQIERELGRLE